MAECTSCERMATAETKIDGHEEWISSVDKEVKGLKNWLMGLMGTSLLSLLLLVANLINKGSGH